MVSLVFFQVCEMEGYFPWAQATCHVLATPLPTLSLCSTCRAVRYVNEMQARLLTDKSAHRSLMHDKQREALDRPGLTHGAASKLMWTLCMSATCDTGFCD